MLGPGLPSAAMTSWGVGGVATVVIMRTVFAPCLAACAALLVSCTAAPVSPAPSVTASPTTSSSTTPAATAPAATAPPSTAPPTIPAAPPALPPVPTPARLGTCPYLTAQQVAQFNGELVPEVQLDAGSTPPACFFSQNGGGQQLSVWVFRASTPEQATAAVDRAAPVATTDPADQPPGWTGGSTGGPGGAVYAVAKVSVAVIVMSNQAQSIKARRVAEQVITALGL